MRLLLTRPPPEAEASAARLRTLGHEVLVAPVLEIVPLEVQWPLGAFDALIATSAHAFLAKMPVLDLSIFVVGSQTAASARKWNPAMLVKQAQTVAGLLELLRAQPAAHFLYLAGQHRKPHLEAGLAASHHRLTVLETYGARAVDTLPDVAQAALQAGQLHGALHYSRRSAEVFLNLAQRAELMQNALHLAHLCLSADVAVPLREAGADDVRTAAQPDEAGLFGLLG